MDSNCVDCCSFFWGGGHFPDLLLFGASRNTRVRFFKRISTLWLRFYRHHSSSVGCVIGSRIRSAPFYVLPFFFFFFGAVVGFQPGECKVSLSVHIFSHGFVTVYILEFVSMLLCTIKQKSHQLLTVTCPVCLVYLTHTGCKCVILQHTSFLCVSICLF